MDTTILTADKDPMGAAIADYFTHHKANKLRVFSSQFDEDEIPVKQLFRTAATMPILERTALEIANGNILTLVQAVVATLLHFKKWVRRYVPSISLPFLLKR